MRSLALASAFLFQSWLDAQGGDVSAHQRGYVACGFLDAEALGVLGEIGRGHIRERQGCVKMPLVDLVACKIARKSADRIETIG